MSDFEGKAVILTALRWGLATQWRRTPLLSCRTSLNAGGGYPVAGDNLVR
jgi:hypothetical protein